MNITGSAGRREKILLLLILLFTLGISLLSIHVPFARDQGVAAYVASLMLDGKAPYRDVYHFNLPGIFFMYALAFKLFGLSVDSINLADALYRCLTLVSVWLLGRKIAGVKSGLWAAFLYGIFSTILYSDYWDMAQKETFTVLPLCLSALLLFSALQSERAALLKLFLSGVFSACACCFKPTLGLAFIVLLAYSIKGEDKPARKRLLYLISMCLGFLLAWTPLIIYLLSHDAFRDMLEGVFIFGRFYGGSRYTGLKALAGLPIIKTWEWLFEWRFLSAAGLIGVIAFSKDDTPGWKFLLLWFVSIYLNVIIQMKFFTYHWIPLLAPVSIFAAKGISEILPVFPRRKSGLIHWAAALLAFFLFLGNLWPQAARYKRELFYDLGLISKKDFIKPYGKWGFGDVCVNAGLKVADYLAQGTAPGQKVLAFSIEPGIYFHSCRTAPTRFAYDQPLTADTRGNERFKAYQQDLREEFMQDLEREHPVYIVVVENDTSVIEPVDSFQQMHEFREFADWIDKYYYLETKIEHYYIYRIKPEVSF